MSSRHNAGSSTSQAPSRTIRGMKPLCVLLLVLTSLSAVAEKPEGVLLKADRDFQKATAEHRLDGWMSYMADNAVLFNINPAVVGKKAIADFYRPSFESPDFQLTWSPSRGEMFPSGDMGYTSGRYEMRLKSPQGSLIVRKGTYLTVWKKQGDGSWKVIADGGAPDPRP